MFKKAKWIWNENAKGADVYAEFYAQAVFSGKAPVKLRISADSNYALYINGDFAESGQYPDFPTYRVYDELDITDKITDGVNSIAVVVWYYGVMNFSYSVSNPGVIFEAEQDGNIKVFSCEETFSRKSRFYISGKNEMITYQQGFNFHIDMNENLEWMMGNISDFKKSTVLDSASYVFEKRQNKKLNILPCVNGKLIQKGTFKYVKGDNYGEKMQYASLAPLPEFEKSGNSIITETCDDGVYIIFDLEKEYVGFLDFCLETEESCNMEIGWGEHLKDGRCRTKIGIRNFSSTVKLKAGQNRFLNPLRRLGCRYIQIFLHTDKVTVNSIGIKPVVYPLDVKKYDFKNVLRNKIYETSVHTLICCMHEHYEDCPWREQALYTLDSRNQMLFGYYAFEEYEFPRSALRLISRGIRQDGLLPICFPTDCELTIPSFSLFFIMQLSEYFEYSKDADTVRYCFATAKTVIETFKNRIDVNGLIPVFVGENYWNFYEWQPFLDGEVTQEKKIYDVLLNSLFSLVIDHYIKLCKICGLNAEEYIEIKKKLNKSIVKNFYSEKEKLFFVSNIETDTFSVLGNSLAFLCGAADCVDTDRMFEIIALNADFGVTVIPATLSMNPFRFDALIRADREKYKSIILNEIDSVYLKMLSDNATTFWETENGDSDFEDAGSLCHGWSALPVYYYLILQ